MPPPDVQSNRSEDLNSRRPRNHQDSDSPVTLRPQSNNFDDDNFFNVFQDSVMMDNDTSIFGNSPTANVGHPHSLHNGDMSGNAGQQGSSLRTDLTNNMTLDPAYMNCTTTQQDRRQNVMTMDNGQRMYLPESKNLSTSKVVGPLLPNIIPATGSSPAARHLRMQQLMQLGTFMYELHNIYFQDEQNTQHVMSESFPTEFAGKVLQAAIAFLKSLRSFFPDDASSLSSSASSSRRHTPPDPPASEDQNFNPSFRPYHRPSSSNTMSRSSSAFTSSSSIDTSARRVASADKPATLQLIACYLRLLQLYLPLYTAIYEYVNFTESDFRRRQPIWSDLSIGGAALHPFADFQIKMVLQVAVHLLEEIEGALGLSEGCRVSKKTANEGSGILGVNVTAHFIEMCMSEVATGSEEGRGAIARLRDTMGRLTVLLDGN